MTRFWKIAAIAILTAAVGATLYKANQARDARAELQKLKAVQYPLSKEVSDLQASLASLKIQLANLQDENARLKNNSSQTELLKLRSEVTRLRPLQDDVATLQQMVKQSSTGPLEWKTNELSDVGCASPVDALKTYIYSVKADPAKLKNGIVGDDVDPPSEDDVQDLIERKNSHLTMTDGFWKIEGYKILSQTWLAPGLAQVEIEALVGDGGGVGFAETFTLRKINSEWKLVVFNVRDKEGNVSTVDYWHEPP